MPIDLKAIAPSDLTRLLNSTPLGEVTSDRRIYKHREQAGLRIGEWRRVNLYRYVAWLIERLAEKKKAPSREASYIAHRLKMSGRERLATLAGRDIGKMPAVKDDTRKAKARGDFRFFCETYLPITFNLKWSPDHLRVLAKVEKAVLQGGLFAMAMPRGSGKTAIAEAGAMWAVLNGHKDFVCLIGASEPHAEKLLESIKFELADNERLLADYPEACFPIRALEGIANRCAGQLYQGKPTLIGWTESEVVLPTIKGSRGSGAIIMVAGLTGQIRGMKYKRHDGKAVRPGLVIIDDPQNDASARSASQCATRMRLLSGAVMGLAGPGKKISGIMPCTVIYPGDVADLMTDRQKHPDWLGERTKMVYAFPTNEKLWTRYAEIRADSFRVHGDQRDATKFYVANREAMDDGAEVAWPQRFEAGNQVSAIQNAMDLRLIDEEAFLAEYQNEPRAAQTEDEGQLTTDQVTLKINGMRRGQVPIGVNHVTMFIDVQGKLLYWIVCGWEDDFTGYVMDYGAHPDQRRPYFTLRDAQRTLQGATKGAGMEGAIYAGLDALTTELLGRRWRRDDGAEMQVGLCLVDANWGASTDVVYQFCQQSQKSVQLLPSHGRFVGAGSRPFSEYTRHPGDRVGLNWRVPTVHGKRAIRHALYDVNYWKTFVAARFQVAMGDRGSLSLFGRKPGEHQLLADHLTAEYRVRTEGRERVVDEWKMRPARRDNHWLDGVVGCAVAAAMVGASLPGTQVVVQRKRKTFSMKGRR